MRKKLEKCNDKKFAIFFFYIAEQASIETFRMTKAIKYEEINRMAWNWGSAISS